MRQRLRATFGYEQRALACNYRRAKMSRYCPNFHLGQREAEAVNRWCVIIV